MLCRDVWRIDVDTLCDEAKMHMELSFICQETTDQIDPTYLLQNGVDKAAMTCPNPIPKNANPLCCKEL